MDPPGAAPGPAGGGWRLDGPAWAALAGPAAATTGAAAAAALGRLLAVHAAARRATTDAVGHLLGAVAGRPYLIGVTGGVAAGKTTFAAALAEHLDAAGLGPVAVVATDGFLLPNEELARRGEMGRKGFPGTYDQARLVAFLADVRAGRPAAAPVYSHRSYDVVPGAAQAVARPAVLVVEGVNVLQAAGADPAAGPLPSDFLDVSVYLHAEEGVLAGWFRRRLDRLRREAADDPTAYFHQFAAMTDGQFAAMAEAVWRDVNLVNLRRHILPTRARAQVVVEKGADHSVRAVTVARL